MKVFESNYPKYPVAITLFLLIIICPYFADCQVSMRNKIFFHVYLTGNIAYEIRELIRTDSCFELDANRWGITSKASATPIWSTCSGAYLVGGYNVLGPSYQYNQYFERVFYNLGYHTMAYFSLVMYFIDTWDYGEYAFYIQVNGRNLWGWYTWDWSYFPSNLCGSSSYRDIGNVRIYGRVLHSGSTLTFRVVSQFDSGSADESFGFRDLSIILAAPSSYPSESLCGLASIPITSWQCSCTDGQYYSGGCYGCHPNCKTCWGGGANQCYACKPNFGFDGYNCIACHAYCNSCYGPSNTQCGSCNSGYLLFNNNTCIRSRECYYPMVATGCNYFCESPCSTIGGWAYWDRDCISTCLVPPQKQSYFMGSGTSPLCLYPCDTTHYLYWDGSCAIDCPIPPYLQSVYKARNYCSYPCPAGQYLYWEGTCSPICVYPLIQGLLFGSRFCFYPCQDPGDFLYWDGSCLPDCNTPFHPRTEKGEQLCDFACLAGQFLYWHGGCSATCDPPLATRIEKGQKYCDHPCPGTEFLHWNNTCQTSCPPHLTSSSLGGKNFCSFPCGTNEYLYWNGTCSDKCDMPLKRTFVADKDFCEYPCGAGEFLYENGSCINNCIDPFTPRVEAGHDYCNAKCPRRTALYWNGACVKCKFPLYIITNATGTYCVDPCNDPSKSYVEETQECVSYCNTSSRIERGLYVRCMLYEEPKISELSKLLHHIRYLGIKLPPKVGRMTADIKVNYLTPRIVPSMFDNARQWVVQNIGTYSFQGRQLYTGFLANFLDDLIIMAMILIGGILCDFLECISKSMGWFYLNIIFERFSVLMKWNVFIILFTSNIGEIILYASIEYKTYTAASVQENVSLGISLLMLACILALYILNFIIAYNIQQFKVKTFKMRDNMTLPDYYRKWQTCQVMFRGLKDKNALTSGFYLIYSIRLAIPMIVASTLDDSPTVQCSFYSVISLLTLLLIVTQKPFKKLVDYANILFLEVVIFGVNCSVLVLSIFNHYNLDFYEVGVFLGDVIIAGNYCVNFLPVIFLPLKLLDGVLIALYKRRHQPTEELGAWIQLLFLPIQQGGLGFEQMELVTAFTISRIRSYNGKVYPNVSSELEHTLQTQNNLVELPRSPIEDMTVFNKSPPSLKSSSPRVPPIKIAQIAPVKRRKTHGQHGSSTRRGNHIEPVEEFKEEDDEVFTDPRKGSNHRYPDIPEEGPELVTTSKLIKERDLTLSPQEFGMGGLDLSQMSPFKLENIQY